MKTLIDNLQMSLAKIKDKLAYMKTQMLDQFFILQGGWFE